MIEMLLGHNIHLVNQSPLSTRASSPKLGFIGNLTQQLCEILTGENLPTYRIRINSKGFFTKKIMLIIDLTDLLRNT